MRPLRMMPTIVTMLALGAALAACSMRPPGTAVPESEAERVYGTLNAGTPLTAVIKSRDVQQLDQRRPTPLLDQLMAELAKTDPDKRYRGVTYALTRTNALDRDWVVQTPDRWNRSAADLPVFPLRCEGCVADIALPACRSDADCGGGATCRPLAAVGPGRADRRVCVGHSDAVIDRLYKLVVQARSVVDITALQPPPDGRFLAALRNGLTTLARGGRPVTVRVLVGQYPLEGGTNATALATELVRDARAVPGSRLTVHVAAMRSCTGGGECASFSWNHSKIVAVDGRAALVGGHNLWSRDYLIETPVHDLSMELRGPAAADASRFADALWGFVCARVGRDAAVQALSHTGGDEKFGTGCVARLPLPSPLAAGGVPVMAVGRLASGITAEFANQSDLARDLMLGAARRSIVIVHQDIAFTLGRLDPLYPESTLERLADFLLTGGGDVHIVLSNLGATGLS
ncbi:MAG: hypothetical protein JNL07_07585, partial [Rhodospirillales bacterium]|nr:hypothetical protein [Rhodospirillales bacterium]